MIDEAIISILTEDTTGFDLPFHASFGLSILLELRAGEIRKDVLFDTGSDSRPILHNLSILEKTLAGVDTICLSHCHYDHTDGLIGVLDNQRRPINIIAHPDLFRPCLEINSDGIRNIGLPPSFSRLVEANGGVFILTKDPLSLMHGVTTTGEIPRRMSFESLENLYTIRNGQVVQDSELDDSALILILSKGLVIISGCAHSGIVNTIERAKDINGIMKVYAIVGGLHLVDADEEKMERTVEALQEVECLFVGHCTGDKAIERLRRTKDSGLYRIHSGMVISLPVSEDCCPVSFLSPSVRAKHRVTPESIYAKNAAQLAAAGE